MPSDYENGAKKTIDISIKAEKMTADVLKSALQEFMSGKAEKKGRMTYKQLQAKSPSKLDSIEVSDRNIGDFLKTARKYDVDFALKRDKSTTPPTYHIFGKSYEYTAKYRAFVKEMKAKEKEQKKRDRLHGINGTSACDTGGNGGADTADRSAVSADTNAPEMREGA